MNRSRAIELMRAHGVAAVVAASPENVCYLTGHVGWAQYVYATLPCVGVFSDDGSDGTDLVVPRSDTPYLAAVPSEAQVTLAYGGRAGLLDNDGYAPSTDEEARFEALQASCEQHATPASAVASRLRERGVTQGKVVVDDINAGANLVQELQQLLPDVDFVAGEGLFLMMRLVKTADEVQRLRDAATVNEDALQKALALIAEGVPEAEVARAWRQEIAGAGGKPLWFHMGSGIRSAYVFPPSDRTFQAGDLFMIDAGLTYKGYFADAGTCGSIGEPSARARREWEAVLYAFEDSVSTLRAGVRGSEIYEGLIRSIPTSALGPATVPFAGHTIGNGPREFPFVLGKPTKVDQPFLPSTSDIELPAGSTVNVELPIGRLGYGGYQIEKSFVLRDGGYDELIETEREMLVVE